ncbi:hypothetical protein MIND_00794900 [Mycena indigotica]|uniref:Uncharacterized protein n=1 Tax=Mycena indigotica TaxID=2126181 RepID=A0A8H6SQ11_9AGAR|nr:uncharacterized protein MIND_00794900 [Mycena indigotica]KAF7302277.1 hypothetical protein MIND_00794900 [Mycena indigotica]
MAAAYYDPPAYSPSQGVKPSHVDSEMAQNPQPPIKWFSETFVSGQPRSTVELALAGSIGDLVQELVPYLASGDIFAELVDESSRLQKVKILFRYLDAHSTNRKLIDAFQKAVVNRAGIEYLLNGDLAR